MKKYDDLYHEINNLLSLLRRNKERERVDSYYLDKFGNDAPGYLLQNAMDKLQKRLDTAEE